MQYGSTFDSIAVIAVCDPFIEDLSVQRGTIVTRESIRLWCNKIGSKYAARLRRRHQGYGDTFFIDEVFIKIQGKQHHLWRAVDQDEEVVDVCLQKNRDAKAAKAAKRFFGRLLKKHKGESRQIVTDKLRSYGLAPRELMPEAIHNMDKYANNRAELSHQPTRVRELDLRRFKSIKQAQWFSGAHAVAYNLFHLGCHLVSAETYIFFSLRPSAS
jgi:putative transposase